MAVNLDAIIKKDKGEKDRPAISTFVFDSDEIAPTFLSTGILSLDLGISGKIRNGGIPKGHITMVPGPSKMGKSFISLAVAKSAQKEGMSTIIIDTERGFSKTMAAGFGLDVSPEKFKLFRGPGMNSIENVKGIVLAIAEEIPYKERENVLLIIDSWGAFVTTKTKNDALKGNEAADMTEAKMLNNLANVILSTGFTCFIVNHIYDNTGMVFGNPIKIRGGKRIYYVSSSVILGVSRSNDKTKDKEMRGFVIGCRNEKGRFAKEQIDFEFRIKLQGGLDMFYGLLPFAMEGGYVEKKAGKMTRLCIADDVAIPEDDIYTADFWKPIFRLTDFVEYVEKQFVYDGTFDVVDNFIFEDDAE